MYTEIVDTELVKILDKHALLTFESKLSLRKEIEKRGLQVNTSGLEESIENKYAQIKNLEYLKDFGFVVEKEGLDGIVVKRTKKAIFTDVLALIAGLLVFFIGLYGIVNFVMYLVNGNDLDVFTLAYKAAIASLVFIGISFFSGLKRLFDYTGFELSNQKGEITLKKRFDVQLEEIKAKASDLFLVTNEDTLSLKLGEETIFTSNADNLIQRMTLEELSKELKRV